MSLALSANLSKQKSTSLSNSILMNLAQSSKNNATFERYGQYIPRFLRDIFKQPIDYMLNFSNIFPHVWWK